MHPKFLVLDGNYALPMLTEVTHPYQTCGDSMITPSEVHSAQASWGSALVHAGAAPDWDSAHARAVDLVEQHYRLDGSLLFCPTRASHEQFRSNMEAVVSYMVGNNPNFPEDKGFALEHWTGVRFENCGIVIRGKTGLAMGNYFFSGPTCDDLKVEYSFVYVRDAKGRLKIQLHHSSLPYDG
jgi:hypothetical protein